MTALTVKELIGVLGTMPAQLRVRVYGEDDPGWADVVAVQVRNDDLGGKFVSIDHVERSIFSESDVETA